MIHMFDGFNWPNDSTIGTSGSDIITNQPPSAFAFPLLQNVRAATNGKGNAAVYSGSNGCGLRLVSRASFSFSNGKLVVGGSFQCGVAGNTTNAYGLLLSNSAPLPEYTATTGFYFAATHLPSLLVNNSTLYLRLNSSGSSSNASSGSIATKEMTGISHAVEHWYEVEYDIVANLINVYIDGALVWTVPYSFTDAQKSAPYFLSLHSYNGGQPSSNNPLRTIAAYVADEVLGPCRVVTRYASSDVSVPTAFGTGPHHPKMAIVPNADITTGLTTKENATAEFGTSGTQVTSEVKAIGIFSKVATTHRSAYETEATITYQLRLNGTMWARAPLAIPAPSVAALAINRIFLSQHPVTNAPFTADDVNNLNFGLSFQLTNKFIEAK